MAPLARAAVATRKGKAGARRDESGERRGKSSGRALAYEHLRGGAAVAPSIHARTMRKQRARSMRRELAWYFASSPLQKTLVSF